ncbi:hypothetical protein HCH_04094 [Hahella chejuensis KCTC 2396]|uniref:Uncharacterized protein n=1 Tax=Hahella chejuensis (strain KCTC 2396) TaxID=349521 RepID=Q2SEW8_HAHCH|nr:hypothetical protein HCH_04094 [Hahella chejuensis KCTC 2396]
MHRSELWRISDDEIPLKFSQIMQGDSVSIQMSNVKTIPNPNPQYFTFFKLIKK